MARLAPEHAGKPAGAGSYVLSWKAFTYSDSFLTTQVETGFPLYFLFLVRHSQIEYATPQKRHDGSPGLIYSLRNQMYVLAKKRHPERFYGKLKQWSAPHVVYLNPTPETKYPGKSSLPGARSLPTYGIFPEVHP
jgi:hypothetical protein